MAKVGEFLRAQALKAGIDLGAENNKPFVDALATLETDIPDHIVELVNRSLISIKEAKNNHGEIKNHYTAQVLDHLDRELESLSTELALPDSDRDELKLEKNSYKRAALLTKKVQALTEAKATANKPDQAKIAQQIAALNGEIAAEKAARAADKTAFENREKDMIKTYALDGMLGQYKTIYDTLPSQARNIGIRTLLQEELRNNAVKLDLDKDGNVVLLTNENQNYFDPSTNTPLNAKQFIERSLAKNKVLVTSSTSANDEGHGSQGSGNNQSGNQNGQNGSQQNQNRQNGNAGNSLLREMNEKAAADYKAAPAI